MILKKLQLSFCSFLRNSCLKIFVNKTRVPILCRTTIEQFYQLAIVLLNIWWPEETPKYWGIQVFILSLLQTVGMFCIQALTAWGITTPIYAGTPHISELDPKVWSPPTTWSTCLDPILLKSRDASTKCWEKLAAMLEISLRNWARMKMTPEGILHWPKRLHWIRWNLLFTDLSERQLKTMQYSTSTKNPGTPTKKTVNFTWAGLRTPTGNKFQPLESRQDKTGEALTMSVETIWEVPRRVTQEVLKPVKLWFLNRDPMPWYKQDTRLPPVYFPHTNFSKCVFGEKFFLFMRSTPDTNIATFQTIWNFFFKNKNLVKNAFLRSITIFYLQSWAIMLWTGQEKHSNSKSCNWQIYSSWDLRDIQR